MSVGEKPYCATCDKTFISEQAMAMHRMRSKAHSNGPADLPPAAAPMVANVPADDSDEVAILQARVRELEDKLNPQPPDTSKYRRYDGPKATRRYGIRMLKMLRPICGVEKMDSLGLPSDQACEPKGGRWWETCPHQPYFSLRQDKSKRRVFSEPDSQGKRSIIDEIEEVSWVERPNLVQVAATRRHDGGNAVALRYQMRGFRFPNEYEIADYCEYGNCWSQDIQIRSRYGNYCSEWQAKFCAADQLQKILEAPTALEGAQARLETQLAEIAL